MMRNLYYRAGLIALGLSPLAANAETNAVPDASSIVSTATTTFNAVGTLCAAAAGFFIVLKLVHWIRK